jgi:hypothetical protein
MKEPKILLLVFLPGFITLIYLSCNEAKVSKEQLTYPMLNSKRANTADYLKQEDQKLIPKSDLIIACQIRILRSGNHTYDTAATIYLGVSIQDCNLTIGSKIFSEEMSISKVVSTKKRKLNCFSRIVVCKDNSGNLKYKVQFSF